MALKHTLYQSLRSPFARRIRVLLEELGVPYELQTVDVFNPPPGFYEVNPLGRVPALRLGDSCEVLIDSNEISHFLEENYCSHPLFNRGGIRQARVSQIRALSIGLMECVIPVFLESLRPVAKRSEVFTQELTSDIHRTLKYLESEFSGPFYFGEKIGVWDIDLGAALGYLDLRMGTSVCDRYPRLRQYYKTLSCRPSFQKTHPPA